MTSPSDTERYHVAADQVAGCQLLDVGGGEERVAVLARRARSLATATIGPDGVPDTTWWPTDGFDAVTWLDAPPEWSVAADEVLRTLRPGGRLVVLTSDPAELVRHVGATRVLVDTAGGDRSLAVATLEPAPVTVAEARAEAELWKDRYLALEASSAMQVVRRLRQGVERAAPAGTWRREAYRHIVARLGRLAASGKVFVPTSKEAPEAPEVLRVPEPVALPQATSEPLATVVIPVHGHFELTHACLRSIAGDPTFTDFETVVVDDASPDDTPERLAAIRGIRVIRLGSNQGFLGAANAGWQAARGRHVVFLNNDTLVQPGWLEALVRTARDPEVGIVGAKLVYPDGTLQEAGGIIWDDATGTNYGRGEDPDDPRFTFVRDVDYCSGACLLVRRQLLESLGGLDPAFAPAYYEDTDLCFAARRLGYRVLYQPDAVVVHVEGASHGTDETKGMKRHQRVNRSRFALKWRDELPRHGTKASVSTRLAAWRARSGRVLVVDHIVPRPDEDSGSRRMFELLKLLSGLGYGVTFCPQDSAWTKPPYDHDLRSVGVEVLREPAELPAYLTTVADELKVAILSRPLTAWANYMLLRSFAPDTTIVYDTVDLHFLRESRRAAVEGSREACRSAEYHRGVELSLARVCDATWVVSPIEADTLRGELPGVNVQVVPNIHDVQPAGPGFADRRGLLFVGSFLHHPNVDAAVRLAKGVLPLVQRDVPDVPLYIVGSRAPNEVRDLESEHVHVLGWVPDLTELYHTCRLFVAPLRFGAGMKGKVGESLSYGLPVVTTPLGAEGMGLRDGVDILLAQDEASMAEKIVVAYRDKELWRGLAENGKLQVENSFSPRSVSAKLQSALSALGVRSSQVEP